MSLTGSPRSREMASRESLIVGYQEAPTGNASTIRRLGRMKGANLTRFEPVFPLERAAQKVHSVLSLRIVPGQAGARVCGVRCHPWVSIQ